MRRRMFNLTTAISLAVLAIVVAGIFSSGALTKYSNYPTALPPVLRARVIKLYRGQVEIIRYDYPPGSVSWPDLGDSYRFNWDGNWMPNGKAIAGFEAGSLPPNRYHGPPGSTAYQIAFPIWPLAIPFLIAPAWWLWKWQRRRRERLMDSSTAFPVGFEQKEI